MKWALLALAVLGLWMCYLAGPLGSGAKLPSGTIEYIRIAAVSDTIIHTAGAIGAGLIGTAATLALAWIQVSENKRKAS